MSEGNGKENGNTDTTTDPDQQTHDPGSEAKTFTQERLNQMMTREKREGRTAATNAIVEQLGVDVEEAAAIIKAAKEREDSEKSEAQKAKDAAEAARKAAESDKSESAKERHALRIERALFRSGIPVPDDDDDAGAEKLSRLTRMVTAEVGAEQSDINAEVSKLREDFPELFAAKTKNDGAPSSDMKGRGSKTTTKVTDAMSRGAELAKNYSAGGRVGKFGQ